MPQAWTNTPENKHSMRRSWRASLFAVHDDAIFINLASKGKFRQFWRYNKFRHISMDGKERRWSLGMNEIQCEYISYAFFSLEIREAKKSCIFSKATRGRYGFQIHMFSMTYDWILSFSLNKRMMPLPEAPGFSIRTRRKKNFSSRKNSPSATI